MTEPTTDARSFGDELRARREQRNLTQADVAARLGVKRETISHWESGRHLPARKRLDALDAVLAGGDVLQGLAAQEREGPPPIHRSTESLLAGSRRAQAALERHLQRDEDGRPLGWCHNLQSPRPPTPVSTAHGIRALLLIDETSTAKLGQLGDQLYDMARPDGGWATNDQMQSRPEAMALVIDALVRIDPKADVGHHLHMLEERLDDVAWRRPMILAAVLQTLLDLRPEAPLTHTVLRALLDNRQAEGPGGVRLWTQKIEAGLADPRPSIVHCARAVEVLARARRLGVIVSELAGEADDVLGTVVGWLRAQRVFEPTTEFINRPGSHGDNLYFRNFTSAWVVRALLLNDTPPEHPALVAALRQVWREFNDNRALWRWSNGDLPIWMTFDGIAALRLTALASLPGPPAT